MENKSANEALVLNIDFQQLFIMKIPYSVLMVFWIGIQGGFLVHATETDILERIQQRYQTISSFQGNFVQSNYITQREKPRKASGVVTYARPGKMRWNYHKPDEQLLVTNGETLWLYDPLLENVTVQSLKEVTPGTTLSFLLGAGNLKNDFDHRAVTRKLIDAADMLIVELKPKNSIAALDFIQLAIDPVTFDFKQIALIDMQGNYRLIAFQDMQYNLSLDMNQFNFDIKEGMEVIDANQ